MKNLQNPKLIALICILLIGIAIAEIPHQMTFQGYLTNEQEPITGRFEAIFRLYDLPAGDNTLWEETDSIIVENGLYSIILGETTPLDIAFDGNLWLGVQLTGQPEMTPRYRQTSVPFAFTTQHADTCDYAISGGGTDDDWVIDGENVYRIDGNVGIGTSSPSAKLTIYSETASPVTYIKTQAIPFMFREIDYSGRGSLWQMPLDGGNIRFDVSHDGNNFSEYTPVLTLKKEGSVIAWKTLGVYGDYVNYHKIKHDSQSGWLEIDPISNNGVVLHGNLLLKSPSTGNNIVEIGEGLDYAEGFDVSTNNEIKPGSVLIIDPINPEKLTLSTEPYDIKVAGIVAGAKNLGSGVRLGAGQFDYDVALAGRVYCNVDASENGVELGDLLTTSSTPGFAIKVIDYSRAQGAIIGKAMQKLEKGQKGQILVLVTLQ